MKFCPKKTHLYSGLSGIPTSTHYVTLEDVNNFHGKSFTEKWLEYIKSKPTFKIDNVECFYFVDYSLAARQADSFLSQI